MAAPWYRYFCRCGATWCGLKTCHCIGCHETFTTITSFDKHRQRGHCLQPADVGLAKVGRDYPCWGLPGAENAPRDRRISA